MKPYNDNKVIKKEVQPVFDEVVAMLEEISRPLLGRMSNRDLYDFMTDAALTAVGNHVCNQVNKVSAKDDLFRKTQHMVLEKHSEAALKKLLARARKKMRRLQLEPGERFPEVPRKRRKR